MSTAVCGPYTQTLFLGASITNFSSSLGYNGDQGRLIVTLAEDPCTGTKLYYDAYGFPKITNQPDFFNPPKVGSPVYFRFGDFSFGGILQNWEEQIDTQGGRTYTVQCTDAVEILEGTQIIINNYTGGVFGIPNLINAFGFNESLYSACNTIAYTGNLNPPLGYTPAVGFGGANVAEDGMSWYQIRDAISILTNSPSSLFGGSLKLRGISYFIDISELPTLDANFRFTGDSITLLETISQVCASSGLDFFTELLYFANESVPPGYGGISGHIHPNVFKFIKIRTVGRTVQRTSAFNVDLTVNSPIANRLNLGKITQFIGNGVGTTRTARGLELRHDITNAFLIGDNRQDLWSIAYSGSQNTYTDTIWPYWGKDALGFPIISSGVDNDHEFTVSTVGWGTKLRELIGNTYTINFKEIRAVLTGTEEWAMYMTTEKPVLAADLEIDAAFTGELLVAEVIPAGVKPHPHDLKKTKREAIEIAAKHAGIDVDAEGDAFFDRAELQKKLYEIIKSYAEFAGKKFMVSLPVICAALDSSAPYSVKLNWVPSDAAWTDSPVQVSPLADALPQTSPVLELLRVDDGRIQSFVYFNTNDEDKEIDYSKLSPDEVIPISNTECYVKATVEEITFLNPVALTYPRAIVSINNPILIKGGTQVELDAPIVDAALAVLVPGADKEFLEKKAGANGDDTGKLPFYQLPVIPQGAAVALRSTNLSYGPWVNLFNIGPDAKTSYERDTTLNPWAFGNTNVMNYAGQVKVETQVTEQIVAESGSVTVPGAPTVRLGTILLAGGPEVTNIDVEVGINGVTSSLRFRTWVPNFGELGRRRIQTLRQTGTFQQKFQRAFIRNNSARTLGGRISNWIRELTKTDRFNRNSSHSVIAAELITDYENELHKRPNVVMTDLRKVLPETYSDYEQKAIMDITGLFRPFAVLGSEGVLPTFESIEPTDANPVTSLSLNPFKTSETYNGTSAGHDIEILSRGSTLDSIDDLSIKKDGSYGDGSFRGVGLRCPVVLVGWGFDTNGKPVPNEDPDNPTDNFEEDYLRKPHLWKAGPLDVRWNEETGTWKATSSDNSVKRGVLTSQLNYRNSAVASGVVFDNDLNKDVISDDGVGFTVYDWLLPPGGSIPANVRIFYVEENRSGRKYVITTSCSTQ